MKKLLAAIASLFLVVSFATPAQSAEAKYSVYQKTLTAFSSTATTLTAQQKAQVKAAVDANPTAEKFICTGIRYVSQPMSVNIMVRKRAKAACEYAKQLNPELSTWYQNKPTQARSYAGKVLLTVKTKEQELSSLSSNAETCRIKENSRTYSLTDSVFTNTGSSGASTKGKYLSNSAAFPFRASSLNFVGELNVAVIPVDWADLPGKRTDYDYYKRNADTLADFYWMASEHNLKLNIVMAPSWFRIPGSYADFYMTPEDEGQRYDTRPKKQALYDAIVKASDSEFDYSDIDIVLPAWPRAKTISEEGGPHEFNFDWNAAMYTDEKTIYDIAGAGDGFINFGDSWFYYAHEIGHMIGIQHMNAEENQVLQQQYRAPWLVGAMSGFDIQSNQDGAVKTFSSWHRFLAGWMSGDQVICTTEEQFELGKAEYFELYPLNEVTGNPEVLMINLDETLNIVIESRRWDERFDRPIVHSRDGLVVYTVDAKKGAAQSNMVMWSPRDITKWLDVQGKFHSEELDGNFCQGDSVQIGSFRIEASKVGKNSDLVKVEKVSTYVDPRPTWLTNGSVNTLADGCVFGPGADREYLKKVDPDWLDVKRGLRSSKWSGNGDIR